MIPETEQWKLNGDCNKCRRVMYCTKDCAKRKRRVAKWTATLARAIVDATAPTQTIAEETKKLI